MDDAFEAALFHQAARGARGGEFSLPLSAATAPFMRTGRGLELADRAVAHVDFSLVMMRFFWFLMFAMVMFSNLQTRLDTVRFRDAERL